MPVEEIDPSVTTDEIEAIAAEPEKKTSPILDIPTDRLEKTKEALVKLYYDQAFQLVVDAAYELSFVEEYRKEAMEKSQEITTLTAEIKAIEESPEYHTRQNRDLVKLKKDQIQALEVSVKALENKLENLPEQYRIACERSAKHIKKAKFIEQYAN